MMRTRSGLYVARSVPNILRFRAKTRTVTLPTGERAKITIDDSGTVRHVEHGDHIDATVRPAGIRLILRPEQAASAVGGFAQPNTIRARTTIRRSNG
jgi:hypothetical protein